MNMLIGLVGLAFLGGEPTAKVAHASHPTTPVRFEVRLLEMDGVDWRGSLHDRLAKGTRNGTPYSWTADREIVADLQKAAFATICAPTVCAEQGAPVSAADTKVRKILADVERVPDDMLGFGKVICFRPLIGEVREGFSSQISGRCQSDGIVTNVALSETRFVALHTVNVSGSTTDPKTEKTNTTTAQIQVPEVVHGNASGEWLVPRNHVLLVSLGVSSTTDAKGKLIIRERLAVIEPQVETPEVASIQMVQATDVCLQQQPIPVPTILTLASPTVSPQPTWKQSLSVTARAGIEAGSSCGLVRIFGFPLPIPHPPLVSLDIDLTKKPTHDARPMPALPSRDLPAALAADGTVVPLPPLPVAVADVPADSSDEPRPSPQAKPHATPLPTAVLARVTRLEAHGNTLVFRDPADGFSKLICEDLVLFPAPAASASAILTQAAEDQAMSDFVCGTVGQDDNTVPAGYVAPARTSESDESQIPSLGIQLMNARGEYDYDGTVNLKSIHREPVTIRVPMADGSVVEITAKVVKKAAK